MPRKATKESKYTTVSIPTILIRRIDEVVASGKYGYQNRTDFILEAIRKRLRELGLLE